MASNLVLIGQNAAICIPDVCTHAVKPYDESQVETGSYKQESLKSATPSDKEEKWHGPQALRKLAPDNGYHAWVAQARTSEEFETNGWQQTQVDH